MSVSPLTVSSGLASEDADLNEHCRQAMAVGSKSFTAAARLFPSRTRLAARLLYSWCRHCDDEVDRASTQEEAKRRLDELFRKTESALRGEPQIDPEFRAFAALCSMYSIPEHYPLELLRGMRMDVEGHCYRTEDDLRLYCYRVAGVVGLMMTHVMGIDDPQALHHAAAAGNAMQMTNIARDVLEDYNMGRVYLPEAWFKEKGLAPLRPDESFDKERAFAVVQRLLESAHNEYKIGRAGLKRLPLSAAFAIAAALEIYEDIGRVVHARGASAWDQRAVVSNARKLWLVLRASLRVLPLLPSRLMRPWRRREITEILTHPASVSSPSASNQSI